MKKEEDAAAQGKGEGQQALPISPAHGTDGPLPVQQVVYRHPQRPGQRHQQRDVREAPVALPPGDGLIAHAQEVGQLLLGQPLPLPVFFQSFAKGVFHRSRLLFPGSGSLPAVFDDFPGRALPRFCEIIVAFQAPFDHPMGREFCLDPRERGRKRLPTQFIYNFLHV